MDIEINRSFYRCKTASVSIKHRFGRRAVLVRDTSKFKYPLESHEIKSPSPQEMGLPNSRSEDVEKLVICAVDARGHFAVEHCNSYSIFAYCTNLDDDKQGINKPIAKIKKKCKWVDHYLKENDLKEESLGHGTPLSPNSHKHSTRTRRSSIYNNFVGLFRGTFANTSFTDAAMEWSRFSTQEKNNVSIENLILKVRQEGRYQLSKSEI
ncbi:unnamed protein product [Phytomonas sp. Hart1]|nr:unnamed protein product [Phytomonas sp. Hart1]|eukprot:CCW67233.1 unnamed protein product [Phytomonas sp. isolate Hart1]